MLIFSFLGVVCFFFHLDACAEHLVHLKHELAPNGDWVFEENTSKGKKHWAYH